MPLKIRQAQLSDLESIVAIYNEAIEEGGFTADLKPYRVEEKLDWFEQGNTEPYGIYVLLEKSQAKNLEEVVGYFYFSPYRKNRAALKTVAEVSFYLKRTAQGAGLGNVILEKILEWAPQKSFEHLMAIILDTNLRSKALLEKWGFQLVGTLPDIAQLKSGRAGQFILLRRI